MQLVATDTRNKKIIFRDLGIMDYKACWDYQEKLFNEIVAQKTANRDLPESEKISTKNYLLFVEHPHVYTLGKSGDEKNLLVNENQLKEKEASYYKINRGGDITYHGPGQLVAYPILDLDNFFTDIHRYLRLLEETIILTLKEYGIESGRSKGETGVWLDADNKLKARKICAMGVRCSRWVTMHGWGFNVNSNLDYFNNIIPCGINDKAVTSLNKELGHDVDMNEIKEKLKKNFASLFEAELV
ncbi:MAG: lipoyl(octanoyl) transferase LipB [Bacteroidia bacterium]